MIELKPDNLNPTVAEIVVQDEPSDVLSADHLHKDLRGRSVRGGFWTLGSQGTQFVIQTVSTVALARLLAPADFGLVAMVASITVLGQAFADLGLSEATIQSAEINLEQVSTLFWINVGIGFGLMLVTMALGPALAWFYHEPRITLITLVMSLTFLIGGLRVQHTALLYRQMRFRSLAIRDVASNVLAVPVGIALAMRGAGYWAIVALPLTFNFAQMVITWLLVRWIPGPPRRSSNVRSLIAFGGSVAGSYLITNIMANADNVLIGWYWGAGPLGFYSRAYNLLMLPVRQLNGPAGSVAVPAFSRLQNDPERFARYYLRMVKLMMWAGAPIFGFLFAAADPVIVVVLGKKWMDAAPVFRILAISALAQMVLGSGIWVLVSRGLSSRLLKVMLVVSSITVASFAVGLPFGVKGVAWAGSLTLACVVPWMLHSSFKGTDITLTRLGQAILIPILLCLTGVGVAELGKYLVVPQSLGARLLVAALSFAGTYALSIAIRPVREELFSFRELLGELRGTAAS